MRIEAAALAGAGCRVEDQCAIGLKPSPSANEYRTAKEAAEKLMLHIRARLHMLRKNSCFVSGHDFSRAVPTPPMRALAPEGIDHSGPTDCPAGRGGWMLIALLLLITT